MKDYSGDKNLNDFFNCLSYINNNDSNNNKDCFIY